MKFNTNVGVVATIILAVISIAFQSYPFGLAAMVALIITGIHHFTNPANVAELPPVIEPTPVPPVEVKPARKKAVAKAPAKPKAKPAAAKTTAAKKPAVKKTAAKKPAAKTARPNKWQ